MMQEQSFKNQIVYPLLNNTINNLPIKSLGEKVIRVVNKQR